MYVFGSNKSYLAKSPSHTSKLQSLRDTFSDCKFLYILRDPEQTISSAISMYKIYRETFYTHANLQEVTDGALNMADYWYDYPIRKIESWNNESSVIVKFEKLIADPDKLIRKLYEKFGYDISDSFYNKLSLLKGKSTTYRSSHQHSLQMYGLNVQDIQKRYNHIYKRYYSSENGNKCL